MHLFNTGIDLISMSTHPDPAENTATIALFGDVFATDFPDWILGHAKKLGLQGVVTPLNDCLQVTATGPDVMLEALALGCSLGPASVMVEEMKFNTSQVA